MGLEFQDQEVSSDLKSDFVALTHSFPSRQYQAIL